jgi:phosphate transport system substrate-binding protein
MFFSKITYFRAMLGILAVICTGVPLNAFATESLSLAGSTAMLPLIKAASQMYGEAHPDIEVSVTGGGSGVGLAQAAIGVVDIGDSDIPAPRGSQLLDHRVAVTGFVLITNADTNIRSLTKSQIAAIFSGQITNWRELGGKNEPIVTINRPSSSGTRHVFKNVFMKHDHISDSGLTVEASGTVVSTVTKTPGAISYVALSAVQKAKLTKLSIANVQASNTTIILGQYPFWAYEHMYTQMQPSQTSNAFISFVLNNSALLKKLGYIPVASMRINSNDR